MFSNESVVLSVVIISNIVVSVLVLMYYSVSGCFLGKIDNKIFKKVMVKFFRMVVLKVICWKSLVISFILVMIVVGVNVVGSLF